MKRIGVVLAGLVIMAGVSMAAESTDPLVLAPDNYTRLFENDQVRVLELHIPAGGSLPMHSHPNHFVYVTGAGTLKLTHPDGTIAEVSPAAGEVLWIPAESHATVNTGTTEFRAIVNELKG